MRGDSVRDLYAKALALLGLAVLAGAGALVDYWPVQGSLPVVSFDYSRYSLPSILAPLEARVALASPVAVPVAQPRVTAPPVLAAPVPADTDMRVETVPAYEAVAAPAAEVSASNPPGAVAAPVADPFQTTASDTDAFSLAVEPMAAPKVSYHDDLAVPSSTNVLQKAGGQVLNAGFAVGTGVAKSFFAFGTAFGNIGKLLFK